MKNMTFQFSKPQLDRLREYVLDDLRSLTELSAEDKNESLYQNDYAEARQLAEYLGASLGKLPNQLKATAKQIRAEQEPRRRWVPLKWGWSVC